MFLLLSRLINSKDMDPITIQHQDKELHITHVSADGKYVLATYEDDKSTKLFKLDIDTLDLSDKERMLLASINSKHQF